MNSSIESDRETASASVDALAALHFDDIEQAFATITHTAARALAVDRVSIWLFSQDFGQLHLVHEYPREGRHDFRLTLNLASRSKYLSTLCKNGIVQLNDPESGSHNDDGLAHYLATHHIRALLDVSVCVDNHIVGVLCHEHCAPRNWSEWDNALVQRLGQITGRIIDEERLRRSRALGDRFSLLIESSVDAIVLATPEGGVEYLNPQARQIFGLAPDEPLLGLRIVDFLQSESRERVVECIYPAARDNGSWTGRLHLRTRQKQAFEASMTVNVYRGHSGRVAHISCIVRDMSEHRHLERRLAEIHQRYETALAASGDCIFTIHANSLAVNGATTGFERLLGYGQARCGSLSLYDLFSETPSTLRELVARAVEERHVLCGEKRIRHAQGYWMDVEIGLMRIDDDAHGPVISVRLRDISERVQHRRDMERLAYYDPLTGLANNNLLRDRADSMLGESLASGRPTGFLLLQLDRWQRILNIQGYQVAESVLQQIGARLKQAFTGHDILLARVLGGVEFALLYDETHTSADTLLARVHTVFEHPFCVDGACLHLNIRAGSARAPEHAVNFKDLTRRAGIALRNAHVRNLEHCRYDSTQSGRVQDERLIEEELRGAIGTDQIELCFQPVQAFTQPDEWVGAEALVRWRHPQLGLLAPADFIPVAEDSQLVIELDRQVLRCAAARAQRWPAKHHNMSVAINFSAVTLLGSVEPADMFREALAESGLSPRRLCLEITETAIMHDRAKAAERLRAVKALGVMIAMDDFGTGYSSLTYLKDLPVDALKIDRDFVRGIGTDSRDESTIKRIIQLGHDLDLEIVAEGVETRSQLEWLGRHDIDYVQGYYIGMPMSETELIAGGKQAVS